MQGRRLRTSVSLALGASIACQAGFVWAIPAAWKVSPRFVQRGTTAEIVVKPWPFEARGLLFYAPGVRCLSTRLEAGGLACTLEIDADCQLGEHPFRIRTDGHFSDLATVHVGPFPIVKEAENRPNTNDTPATALPVPLGTTVLGRLSASRTEDVDCFRVPGKAGGRLSVEVDAVRIDDVHDVQPRLDRFDTAVTIFDPRGVEIAHNDDSPLHRQDPLVSVRMPEDGDYVVAVRRVMFFDSETSYAVHIGSFARPLAAFPPGGPAGQPLAVTLLGDPLGPISQTVQVPATAGTFLLEGDAASPLRLRSSPFPNVLEDPAQQATPVPSVPVALNGILAKPGEIDRFRVAAAKGVPLRVRVWASGLGTPVDPRLSISPIAADGVPGAAEVVADDTDPAGRDIIAATGDFPEVFDPSVIWTPQKDGDYLLEIGDSRGAGGDTAVYRVEIEPPPPAVLVALRGGGYGEEDSRASTLAVPRGGRWTINVKLAPAQGSGFSGPFDLIAEGLPEGVRLESPRVPAGVSSWPVALVAEPDAKPTTALFSIMARPVDADRTVATSNQQNIPRVNYQGDSWRSIRLDRFAMAVVEPAPFSIAVSAPNAALVRGGEMTLPVKITRRAGFEDPIHLQAMFAPPGVGLPPLQVVPTGDTTVPLHVSCASDAPLGSGPCYVIATTSWPRPGPDGKPGPLTGGLRVSSAFIELSVAEPFVKLSAEPQSIRRGDRLAYRWAVKQVVSFPDHATARLVGLPVGVTTTGAAPTLDATTGEITFGLEATDDALVGLVNGLACELTFTIDDQEIRLMTGAGKLRIDPRQN
jgi:hypothetical protein